MLKSCSYCQAEIVDGDMICKSCFAFKCVQCADLNLFKHIPMALMGQHLLDHELDVRKKAESGDTSQDETTSSIAAHTSTFTAAPTATAEDLDQADGADQQIVDQTILEETTTVKEDVADSFERKRLAEDTLNAISTEVRSSDGQGSCLSDRDFFIRCSKELHHGCSKLTSADNEVCSCCGKSLLMLYEGDNPQLRHRLSSLSISLALQDIHIGDIIYFIRRRERMIEKGILIGASTEGSDHVIVRYFDKPYRMSKHDESIPLTEIFKTMQVWESQESAKKRTRRSL
jgi:hypothetical protein